MIPPILANMHPPGLPGVGSQFLDPWRHPMTEGCKAMKTVHMAPKGVDFVRMQIAQALHKNPYEAGSYAAKRWGDGSRAAAITEKGGSRLR